MNYAVILSGGVGSRFGSDIPKQYIEVEAKPIIQYTLEKFFSCSAIDEIVIVAADVWHDSIKKITDSLGTKPCHFAVAGKSRQGSIYNGLCKCMEFNITDEDNVVIHDAVRPLVCEKLISDCVRALEFADAVMPVLPVVDTIYVKSGNYVSKLLNRDELVAGQSPEAFKLKKYYELNKRLSDKELDAVRGSSELAHMFGLKIKIIDGQTDNFKITQASDLIKFASMLKENR